MICLVRILLVVTYVCLLEMGVGRERERVHHNGTRQLLWHLRIEPDSESFSAPLSLCKKSP